MTQSRNKTRRARPVDQGAKQLAILKAALRKWGMWATILGFVLAVTTGALVWHFWKPQYVARQFIEVKQDIEFQQLLTDGQVKFDPKLHLSTIKSKPFLQMLLLDPDVNETLNSSSYEAKIKELQNNISYRPSGSEHYSIEYTNEDPKNAALVVKKIAEDYVDRYFVQDRSESIDALTSRVEEKINASTIKVQELENQLLVLKRASNFNVNETGTLPLDVDGMLLVDLKSDLKEAKLVEENLNLQKEPYKEQLNDSKPNLEQPEISALVDNDGEVIRAREYLFKLRTEQERTRNRAKPVRDQAELAVRRQSRQLAETIDRVEKRVCRDCVQNSHSQAKAEIANIDLQIRRNRIRIIADEAKIKELMDARKLMLEQQSEFNKLTNDRLKAESLLAKWEGIKEGLVSKEISRHLVAIDANQNLIPTEPIEKYPFKLLGISTLVAFLAPFLIAFLIEFKADRIAEPTHLVTQTTADMIGEVSRLPRRIHRNAISKRLSRQVALYEESVDSISAAIHFGEEKNAHVIAICSAASSEGKTTLASQFAMSAARTSAHKTLLIDGDIRRPNIHRVFDANLDCGLVDVLDGSASLEDAVINSGVENLDILVAGKLKLNPMRYFAGESWQELLAEMKNEYSQIVIDTAPVLAASESLAIAKSCDIAILCVLRDVSRHNLFQLALERLQAADVDVAGFVFGGVPQRDYANKYGKYHYELSKSS